MLLALSLLVGLSVLIAGPFLAQDRCHSEDRFIVVIKAPPAPTSAPVDSPRPVSLLDLSPVFVMDLCGAMVGPDDRGRTLLPAQADERTPGFRSRVERPPRRLA
jgi:hypothetical protein